MKIGVDLRHMTVGASGGVPLQVRGVCQAAHRLYPDDEYYIFCSIFNRSLITIASDHFHVYSLPTVSFYPSMEDILRQENVDVLFRGYPVEDTLAFPLSRQIFLIPDLQHEYLPEFFTPETLQERRKAFDRAMAFAGALATNTQFTRQSILDHPANRCKDICLIPPGLHTELPARELVLNPVEEELLPKKRFFYYPANLWPHKNHRRILQAFQLFLDKNPQVDAELILTGHPAGWEALSREYPTLPVRHLGYVRMGVVRYLYEHAEALLFFSLYEGLGQPFLEAFAARTPILCSNTTALPEVGGDAVLSCDPLDIEAMSQLMQRILGNEALRSKLTEKGYRRLSAYTWEQSAENFRAACQRVLERSRTKRSIDELPLVSIVTPSYNQGRFLKRTIDSVLNQTYPKIEYIVMDGASNDESVDILQSYGDRFVWQSEKDRGQTDAVNKGFARSHGTIRGFLNSDDTLLPEAIEKVVNVFLEYPNYDLVYGKSYYIDENDQVIGEYRTAEYSFERLMLDNCICQPATFWQTRIAERVGPLDDSLHYSMDYEYWLRIDRMGGKLVYYPEYLANYRLHAEAKTLSAREKIYREAFQVCKKHGGYVSLSYIQGLWYHRLWEKPGLSRRLVRAIPGMYRIITLADYARINSGYHWQKMTAQPVRQATINLLHTTKRELIHLLKSNLDFLRPLVRKIRRQRYRVEAGKPVFGVWPDNWLGPLAQFYVQRKNLNQELYLEGIPAKNLRVNIKLDQAIIEQKDLAANQPVRLMIPAEIGQKVQLEFSSARRDPEGRYLTFLLQDTNLFAEYDPLT